MQGWFPPDFWGAGRAALPSRFSCSLARGSSLAPPRTCGLHSSPDARWSTRREKSLVRQEKRGSGSGSSCEFAEGVVKAGESRSLKEVKASFLTRSSSCSGGSASLSATVLKLTSSQSTLQPGKVTEGRLTALACFYACLTWSSCLGAQDVFLHLSDCGSHVPRVGDGVRFTIERTCSFCQSTTECNLRCRRAANPKQLQAKSLPQLQLASYQKKSREHRSVTFTGRQSSISQNQTGVVKSISSTLTIEALRHSETYLLQIKCRGEPRQLWLHKCCIWRCPLAALPTGLRAIEEEWAEDVFFLISNCKEGMPMPGDTVTFDVRPGRRNRAVQTLTGAVRFV